MVPFFFAEKGVPFKVKQPRKGGASFSRGHWASEASLLGFRPIHLAYGAWDILSNQFGERPSQEETAQMLTLVFSRDQETWRH